MHRHTPNDNETNINITEDLENIAKRQKNIPEQQTQNRETENERNERLRKKTKEIYWKAKNYAICISTHYDSFTFGSVNIFSLTIYYKG